MKPPGPPNREEPEELPVAIKLLLVMVILLILSIGVGFVVKKWRVETTLVQMEMCATYGIECTEVFPLRHVTPQKAYRVPTSVWPYYSLEEISRNVNRGLNE